MESSDPKVVQSSTPSGGSVTQECSKSNIEGYESLDMADKPNLKAAKTNLNKLKYDILRSSSDKTLRFCQLGKGYDKTHRVDNSKFDQIGDAICDWVQAYMMDAYQMHKEYIPLSSDLTSEESGQAPIFRSPDWHTNSERALVLIQGTGMVRAGLWTRSVCVKESIDLGSVIPDLEFAKQNGFSAIVFNPNYDVTPEGTPVDKTIKGMVKHSVYAWDKFVENGQCPAKEIYVVAHSAGGGCIQEIIEKYEQTMIDKVRAIAFTDALYGDFVCDLTPEGKQWSKESCIAYNGSEEPLDTPIPPKYLEPVITEVSAGHPKHAYTTGCARESYLKWFLSRSLLEK